MPFLVVLCSLEFLPVTYGIIDIHSYRQLRGIVMPFMQALPNVIITTYIFYQGATPLVLSSFQRIDASNYHDKPHLFVCASCNHIFWFNFVGHC